MDASSTELDRRTRQQEVVAELGQRALETDDVGQLLHDAAAAVTDTLDTEYCYVLELLPGGDEALLRAGLGWGDDLVGSATVSTGVGSEAGYALVSEKPVVVEDFAFEQRFSGSELVADHDVTSSAVVVVGPDDAPWGVFGVHAADQRTFSEHDANVLRSVATVLASAIQNQRAESEVEEIYGRISEAFFALDEEFRFTHLNDRANELINPEDRDLVGKRVWDEFPEAVGREFEEQYRHAMREQEAVSFEEYYPDPLDAWFDVRAYPSETGLSVHFRDVTERKRAQRDLADERDMFAEGPAVVFRWAAEDGWPVEYVSRNVTDVLGYTPEELESESVPYTDLLVDEEIDRLAREAEEHSDGATERFSHDPYRVETKDGGVKWVQDTTKILRDESGEVTHYLGYLVDITERKERERQLEQSERRYRTLAENFPNGAVAVYDDDLRYTLTQGAVLGESLPQRDQLEGKTVHDVFPSQIVDDLAPLLRAAVDEGETGSATFQLGDHHFRVWATPLREADGSIFAGLTFAQDVTGQVEREQELERTLDLLNKTERIADVAGWEVTPDTNEVFWSNHLFDILDVSYTEQPTLEEALAVYHTEEDAKIVENAVEEALETGESFDVEARFPRPADDVGWLRVQGAPEVVDGEIVSLRGAVQDVTERKHREQRLEELIDRLEESNERLEQFAYAASHDLQEPLRMVSSYLRLIERRYADELDEDGQEFIEYAVDGADRMREMIEGLLEYSRVDSRGNPLEPVDLDAVFADVLDDLQVRIEESDAVISHETLPTVDGDAGQLRQLFQNLLDNAIEYSGDEPPRVEVTAERDGEEWVLSVSDQGIGIDARDVDRVFEVFQSLHTQDEHAGTGIGLALCERIVERHGGEIWVDSEPGEGTTFTFALPAKGEYSE